MAVHTERMRRQDAEAQRVRLQLDDHDHTYLVREQPAGNWEVVRIDLPHRASEVRAERGEPADLPDDPRLR